MRITDRIYIVGSRQLGISGPWDSHVYLLEGPRGLVLIDAGGGGTGEIIAKNIRTEGFDPSDIEALLVTHCHFDHVCGAAELREMTGCEVYLSAQSKDLVEEGTAEDAGLNLAKEQGVYPMDFEYRNCKIDHGIEDGDVLDVGGLGIQAISVEGHSPDSVCFMVEMEGHRNLFAGDVLFYGGVVGLINALGSTMDGFRKDLKKLGGLGVDGLYPGHMLFTVTGGQQHIDAAIQQCGKGTVPQSIGQFGTVF
jgi:hydroxyacylglutathione hydrolase